MLNRRTLFTAAGAVLAAGALPRLAQARSTLVPYAGDAEMAAALQRWRQAAQRRRGEARREAPAMNAAPAAPAAALAKSAAADGLAESITNVQVAGVDEGGIVKRHGDHLVILRRGRLFTVRVGGDALRPVAAVDAFAPGSDPAGAWYDELLVQDDTLVVVGYSYARGGTEIGLFDIARDGRMRHRATHHLRSFDYWSSRNYASRLVGGRLVFYTPQLLQPWGPEPMTQLPAWRRWQGTLQEDFRRILPATRVYRTDDDFDPAQPLALHTVTTVNLDGADAQADSTAVLGPAGRVFHVSAGSVYVWTAGRGADASAVFRLPLDGSAPTALKTAGVPVDQLSFLEADGHLNVLLQENGRGEAMWNAERGGGALALLRVPLDAFGDGRDSARPLHYRRLPGPRGGALQNRHVGDWLLWGAPGAAEAWAVRPAGGDVQALRCGHGIERIEALGRDALLVGNAGADLHLSTVRLERGAATLAARHVEPGTRQGETRTHGFFFRADGPARGLLGLPVVGGDAAAAVLVLRAEEGGLRPVGELVAQAGRRVDDRCRASCVDWYGNARPVFLGERVLALLGYEIVEGRLAEGDRLEERRRISFAPQRGGGGRYSPFG